MIEYQRDKIADAERLELSKAYPAPAVFKTVCSPIRITSFRLFLGFLFLTTRLPLGVIIDKPQLAHSEGYPFGCI